MKSIFKKHNFILMVPIAIILISGCARKPDKSQVVAKVNNYEVTTDDFNDEVVMSIPGSSKEAILENIIDKELLLEEAQKMNFDKDKKFMKEIENYWKQALIKRIIEQKGNEFLAMSKVSDEEVNAEYRLMEKESEGKIKPYDQIAGQIRNSLRMKKAQALLDFWIKSLEKKAKIKKYQNVLNGMTLKETSIQNGGADE